MANNVTKALSGFVMETGYEDMPSQAIVLAKQAFLDTIGVALAGSMEECCRIVREWVSESNTGDGVPVLGTGLRTLVREAALANAMAAHALDYDDCPGETRNGRWLHPSSMLVPVVLGLGQQKAASGRQVIEAYLLGLDVMGKVMNGLGPSFFLRGWHSSGILGTLGGAAAAGKLLGLSLDQMCMAFGIATSMSSGTRQNFGTMTKPLQVGMAARNGIIAASLAAKGFTADPAIFDTPKGFGYLFADEGDWMPERVSGFGNPWEIIYPGLKIKRYPCCGGGQRSLDAVLLEILPNVPVKAEEVSRVEVRVPASTFGQGMVHRRPRTGLQGKFSQEYCMAAALIDGDIRLATFTDEAVLRPVAQEFLEKVSEVPHGGQENYVEVTLKLRDGSCHTARVVHASGSPTKPLTREQLEQKFRNCARTVLSEEKVAQTITLITRLDEAADITPLMENLTVPDRV